MNRSRWPSSSPCKSVVYGDGGNRTRELFPPSTETLKPVNSRGNVGATTVKKRVLYSGWGWIRATKGPWA